MNKIYYVTLIFCLFFSCKGKDKKEVMPVLSTKELTKLEHLFLLPPDSVIAAYDLSNDSITSFPDLSHYTIKSLDLSGNFLDTLITSFLPKKLERLNLSHNRYKGELNIAENTIPYLKELDVSYNELRGTDIKEPLYRINLSHNDVKVIFFNHDSLRYLDVSYNLRLTSPVTFHPSKIDTVVSKGVEGGKRLRGTSDSWVIDEYW